MPCNSNCKTCTTYGVGLTNGSATTCLTCTTTSKYLLNSVCYSVCPRGYYHSFPLCVSCMTNCLTCSSATQCLTCTAPYSYHNNKCLNNCPSSYVSYFNSPANQSVCLACPTNCAICTNTSLPVCINCLGGYYLNSGACVANCSGGKLPDKHNICSIC